MLQYTSVPRILTEEPKIGSASTITSAQMFQSAEGAEAIIDASIIRHYALPVSSGVGHIPLLTAIATDLSLWRILRRVFTADRLKDSEWHGKWKDAISDLNDVAKGKKLLVDSGGNLVAARTDVAELWSNTKDHHPTFSELDPTLEFIDEDKLEELLDARDIPTIQERLT